MNRWMIGLGTVLALNLAACQPADVKVKSVKDQLDAGEVVEFSQAGYRRPSCSSNLPDWSEIGLGKDPERERIVLKTQAAVLNPGRHSCYRVGSVVNLKANNKTDGMGKVRIRKLALVYLSKLESRHLKGRFFAKSEDFAKYKSDLETSRMKAAHEGIVTIVEFDYVSGTAVDQKLIEEKNGYKETANSGERVGECPNSKVWNEIEVPLEFHALILGGQIKSWYRLGDRNCISQGQEVDIKATLAGGSSGKVRVTKVKLFKTDSLRPDRFSLGGLDYEKLRNRILEENQVQRQEWIVVYDVESLSGTPPSPPMDCRVAILHARTGADVSARRFKTVAPLNNCLQGGDLLILVLPIENGTTVEVAARVVATEKDEQAGTAFVTVERIDQGAQP